MSASTGVMVIAWPDDWRYYVEGDSVQLYIGVDWATTEHQVCVVNVEGDVVQERVVPQTGVGLREFVAWLHGLCGDRPACVAIGSRFREALWWR